jgi:hypothetical protein
MFGTERSHRTRQRAKTRETLTITEVMGLEECTVVNSRNHGTH